MVGNDNNQISSWYIGSTVFYATIDVTLFFVTDTGNIPIAEEIDFYAVKCVFDVFKFRLSNDGFNLFQNVNFM